MPDLTTFTIRPATPSDVPLILSFIRDLAHYERLSHEMTATEELLHRNLFGERPYAEVVLAYYRTSESDPEEPVGFALYFHNFSTFLGKPGIYLEDLYVDAKWRGHGFGKRLLVYLAALAKERECGRVEWSVLDWNEVRACMGGGDGITARRRSDFTSPSAPFRWKIGASSASRASRWRSWRRCEAIYLTTIIDASRRLYRGVTDEREE
ncbi:GCN5-related N-acetyltransferase [Jimgerdemannia flammicorona]|uniref:GCN5-related N-acetyltransferase n=1 Tax=Jimgerdemannia flammicorona TaxID=994334 RepID=A0A433D7D0_9FUNG|nr:GCN5-related N-acetyltransferase [Jimgerdemannia flammicorona]